MDKYSDLWRTQYTDNFSDGHYLYHYTDFVSAIKILSSNKLLFSPIGKTNHMPETKRRVFIPVLNEMDEAGYQKAIIEIEKYYGICNPYIRMLCFSMDTVITDDAKRRIMKKADSAIKFYDVLGRGFALPGMWAKYSERDNGVCFILDKAKLLESISGRVYFVQDGPVTYKSFFDIYTVTDQQLKKLLAQIGSSGSKNDKLRSIIQSGKEFFTYSFFEKFSDWKGEHEYRIIALSQEENSSVFVDNLSSLLCGVVVKGIFAQSHKEALSLLMRGANIECEIKKIVFKRNYCKLE